MRGRHLCQPRPEAWIHHRLIDMLYVDAMVLADEARSYFDAGGHGDHDALPPLGRVAFSCESLKVTTRLMHIIAWLLTQRAILTGEMAPRDALDPSRRLGPPPASDPGTLAVLPDRARALVEASADLYRRVSLLDAAQSVVPVAYSPARSMQERLAVTF